MKRLCLAAAIATSLACMRTYALLEVSGDYTISGSVAYPVRFTGDANLTIAANATTYLGVVTNDGHNVTINLEDGCACQVSWFESLNGGTTTVNFKGGRFTDAGGWGSYWFKADSESCVVNLVSVDGNPIWITQPNYQYKYFKSQTTVYTSGTGCFYVQTPYMSGTTCIFFWMNVLGTNYGHTGGTRFSGVSDYSPAWIYCGNDPDRLPPGLIEIGRTANIGGAWLNLNGASHVADKIVRIGAIGGVTNMTGTAGTLVFSSAAALLDCPVYGNAVVRKTGAATTLTVKSGPISTLESREGTVLVKPDTAGTTVKVGKLRVYSGATLTVDGGILEAAAADIGLGATVACVNGGKLRIPVAANKTNVMDAASWSSAALEKTGAGLMGLGSDSAASLSSVNVTEGTLKLGCLAVTNRFWRVSFKKAISGGSFVLGPFRLYNRTRAMTDGGSSNAGNDSIYADKSSAGLSASQLAANQFICSRTDYSTASGVAMNPKKPVCMFWNGTVYSCAFPNTPYPSVGNPASWVVMTYRIPNTAAASYGYDVRSQWDGWSQRCPSDWTLESSPDGTDGSWELVDEKSGQTAINGQTWYHGGNLGGNDTSLDPYTFQTLRAGGGISPAANVQVAAGATLDATLVDGGQAVSSLTVDCTAGGGTLKGVKLAAGGTLNLVNVPAGTKLVEYAVPLTFEGAGDTLNARTWSVQVDGVANRAKLKWQGGGLFVPSAGTIVIFR